MLSVLLAMACSGVTFGQGIIERPTTPKKTEQKQTAGPSKSTDRKTATGSPRDERSLTPPQMAGKGDAAYGRNNYKEAFKWYSKAAEQGDTWSQNRLGEMYQNGHGVTQDIVEAVKWYRMAAEQGNAEAQCNLGYLYIRWRDTPTVTEDIEEGVKWFIKSADQGNPNGQCALALAYRLGYGVKRDFIKALQLFEQAAAQGNKRAKEELDGYFGDKQSKPTAIDPSLTLSQIMSKADAAFDSKDYPEALSLYLRAAELGNPRAQCRMGYLYDKENWHYPSSIKWYWKAAQQGDAEAQYNIGLYYDKNHEYEEALNWYMKSSDQGYYEAQYHLGDMYRYEKGVKRDYSEAAKWYRKAAEQGHDWSQYNLGVLYSDGGLGLTKDPSEAAKWYRKAADQDHKGALLNLGVMYLNGSGVTKDHAETKKLWEKAAALGDATAKQYLIKYFD